MKSRRIVMGLLISVSLGSVFARSSFGAEDPSPQKKVSTTQKAMDWLATFRKSEKEKKAILAERENHRIARELRKKAEEDRKNSGESAAEIKKKFNERMGL